MKDDFGFKVFWDLVLARDMLESGFQIEKMSPSYQQIDSKMSRLECSEEYGLACTWWEESCSNIIATTS